jgi:hypothetical protein
VIRFSLGDTACDDADADLGHEFDRYARTRVGTFEVVDELLEVLDGVDVVVRWG